MNPSVNSHNLGGKIARPGIKRVGLIGSEGTDWAVLYELGFGDQALSRWGRSRTANLVKFEIPAPVVTEALQSRNWSILTAEIQSAANGLVRRGAKALVLCSSLLHIGTEKLELNVPLLHIAIATAAKIREAKITRVGLLGTRSRESDLIWRGCCEHAGVNDIFVPTEKDRTKVTRIIVDELQRDVVLTTSSLDLLRIIYSLRQAGAQAVVLVAPELARAFSDTENILPYFDARECHIAAALDWASGYR